MERLALPFVEGRDPFLSTGINHMVDKNVCIYVSLKTPYARFEYLSDLDEAEKTSAI